jgi:hypothetical protein
VTRVQIAWWLAVALSLGCGGRVIAEADQGRTAAERGGGSAAAGGTASVSGSAGVSGAVGVAGSQEEMTTEAALQQLRDTLTYLSSTSYLAIAARL